MSKHTPGPWSAINNDRENDECEYWIIDSEYGAVIGEEGIWLEPSKGSNKYNASLIAAAPDLLEELQKARVILKHSLTLKDSILAREALPRIDAAIAKALVEAK